MALPHTSGRGLDQTAKSHHRPRCERHRAGQAARGNPQQHQKTISPGQCLCLDLIVLVCRDEMVLMLCVCLGGDEVDPPVRPKDSGEFAAGSRALLR